MELSSLIHQILFTGIINFSGHHPTLNLRCFPCRIPCFSILPNRQKYTIFSFSFYPVSAGVSLCLLFSHFSHSVQKFWSLSYLAELFGKAFLILFREIHPNISMVANDHLKIFFYIFFPLFVPYFLSHFQRRKFY